MISTEEARRLDALRRYAILDTPPEPNFDRLTRLASDIFEKPVSTLALADKDRFWFKSAQGVDGTEMPRRMAFCEQTIQGDCVFVVPDALNDPRFAEASVVVNAPHLRFYAGAPLITPAGVRIGSLCVLDTQPRQPFTEREQRILTDLAQNAVELLEARSRQIELTSCTDEIAYLARHDPLTGLANRRRLVEVAETQFGLLDKRGVAVLLYLDLDGFKRINDAYGHEAGDDLLKQVSARLRGVIPEAFLSARLGGDEFVVMMSGSEEVATFADALSSELVAALSIDYKMGRRQAKIGVSIGVAIHRGGHVSLDDLLREADLALYQAKMNGRGQVVRVQSGRELLPVLA